MKSLLRLGVSAFALAVGAFVAPAQASLETTSDYSALPQDQIVLTEYSGAVSCAPTGPHYVPSFIRALDGTIIGVGYLEVESEAAAGC